MLKNKIYYKKIFNQLIPKTKKYNSYCFSDCVNIDKFFIDIKKIDIKAYNILVKKKNKKREVVNLIGDYILEGYFLSKKVNKKLIEFEKKNYKDKSNYLKEKTLFNLLKLNARKN